MTDASADEPVPATIDERLEFLELQLTVACATASDMLAEAKELRLEIRAAIERLAREAD